MSGDDAGVLSGHGGTGVPLAHVLDESVALVNGATHYLAVLGEDDFYVSLLDNGCVEIADEDSGVEGARVILVGHVAGLSLTSHCRPVALLGHRQRDKTLESLVRPASCRYLFSVISEEKSR